MYKENIWSASVVVQFTCLKSLVCNLTKRSSIGTDGGNRTHDEQNISLPLYRLSYTRFNIIAFFNPNARRGYCPPLLTPMAIDACFELISFLAHARASSMSSSVMSAKTLLCGVDSKAISNRVLIFILQNSYPIQIVSSPPTSRQMLPRSRASADGRLQPLRSSTPIQEER